MDEVDLGRGRFVGIAIIAVTLAAIAVLFAGQGPIVAAGALVGLILGLIAGLLALVWLSRIGGRSFSFRSMMPGEMVSPDSRLLMHMEESADVAGTDLGPVRSVRSVVDTVEARGISLSLIAIEHRVAGATITFEARGSLGVRVPIGMPVVRVTDDRATTYRTASNGGNGMALGMRFETNVLPAPPPDAHVLTVSVDGFMEFDPWASKSIDGPWVFEVRLDQ